jgi:hypothetical protein
VSQEKEVNISMNSMNTSNLSFKMNNSSLPVKVDDAGKRRRRFFDEALKIKSSLDPGHPGKKMLVS